MSAQSSGTIARCIGSQGFPLFQRVCSFCSRSSSGRRKQGMLERFSKRRRSCGCTLGMSIYCAGGRNQFSLSLVRSRRSTVRYHFGFCGLSLLRSFCLLTSSFGLYNRLLHWRRTTPQTCYGDSRRLLSSCCSRTSCSSLGSGGSCGFFCRISIECPSRGALCLSKSSHGRIFGPLAAPRSRTGGGSLLLK